MKKRAALIALLVISASLTAFLFVGFVGAGMWATAIQVLIPWGMVAGYFSGYRRAYRRTRKETDARRAAQRELVKSSWQGDRVSDEPQGIGRAGESPNDN